MRALSKLHATSVFSAQNPHIVVPKLTPNLSQYDAPAFSAGDVISFSASTTRNDCPPRGYRIINKNPKTTMFSEAIKRYPMQLKAVQSCVPLLINAYPAFILPPENAVLVDTYLSLKTASRALQLAAEKNMTAIIVAPSLFMMEILLHHCDRTLKFPKNLVLFFGGYPLPLSLHHAIQKLFEDKTVNVSYMTAYGVAEIDASLFYAVEQTVDGQWLYHPRSDVRCKITDCDEEGFGRLLVSVGDLPLLDAGDWAKKEGNAYFIRSNPKKVSTAVLTLLESWSPEDWKRRTGYLAQHKNMVYFQLRRGYTPETGNELSFCSYADQFDFAWQEKPKWNYCEIKSDVYVFFNQFHCLDPSSSFVKNYLYPTSKGVLLAEEIMNVETVCKQNHRLYQALRKLTSEIIAQSLSNEGVSDSIIDSKLTSDSLTILRNPSGKIVGILTFSCSQSKEDFMYMGLHLLDEARNRDVMKVHHILTVGRAMNLRKTDYIQRLSKTHSPIAMFVEQKIGNVEPNIEVIKPKLDQYIQNYLTEKLISIQQKNKCGEDVCSDLDALNQLILNGLIIIKVHSKNHPTIITRENCDEWLISIRFITINLSKLMSFSDQKYAAFKDFKTIDKSLRAIFSKEIEHIKPRILARMRSLIGHAVDDRAYFDSDYLVHRRADPPYNLSEVIDGPIESVNCFLRGALNYTEGDIFVYTTSITRETLLNLKQDLLEKLPPVSKRCFHQLDKMLLDDDSVSYIDGENESSISISL